MSTPFVAPRLQRTLSTVYRFYDAFFYPTDVSAPPIGSPLDRTPPIGSPLDVSIPELRWTAIRAVDDFTYRFSILTLTRTPPAVTKLVQVTALGRDYVSFETISLTLPLSPASPPSRSDFLKSVPLWPTTAMRPPAGETAVRGVLRDSLAQPVPDLKVEMWVDPAVAPPLGTPYTKSNANGEFLYRFPLLKGVVESTVTIHIRLNDGAVAVSPFSLPIVLGRTQIIHFQRS